MAEADVRLTEVTRGGAPMSDVVPAGSMTVADGKNVIAGKWKIPNIADPIDLEVSGMKVKSVQTPFGNQPFMAEVDESAELFGLHVTMGGFPMKAWMSKDGVLQFSNGGRWSKI